MTRRKLPDTGRLRTATNACRRDAVRTIGSFAVALLAVVVIGGCGDLEEPAERVQQTSQTRRAEELFLTPQLFVDAFLLTDDNSHRWRFTDKQFIVESLGQPLSNELTGQLMLDPSDDYRISGMWRLNATQDRLVLSAISADRGTARASLELPIAAEGSDRVKLAGVDYRFAESLPLREVLPERVYTAHVVEFQQGDLIRVRDENGEIKDLRLFGVACPKPDQPHGREAIEFGYEKTNDAEVYVKVFGVDADGREIAQVWVAHLRYLNMELLDAGLAWHDKRSDDEWILATAEDDARDQRAGLWADEKSVPPWHWPDQTGSQR